MTSLREQAGLPGTRVELTRATLEAMRKIPLPASNDQIATAVADILSLNEDQRSIMHLATNQTEVAYNVAWARTRLRSASAVERVGRALWSLSDEGWQLDADEVERRYSTYLRGREPEPEQELPLASTSGGSDSDPSDWRGQLLARLARVSPDGFEHLSGALLRAAGFHGVTVTRQSGDGGIDAFAVYRPQGLISFRTTVQCKRWTGGVGADRVQAFQGASMGKADRGILITTGHFTPAAEAQAQAPGAFPVDLIDGNALCELLREHSLGVRTVERRVEDILVDHAYFAQFEDTK